MSNMTRLESVTRQSCHTAIVTTFDRSFVTGVTRRDKAVLSHCFPNRKWLFSAVFWHVCCERAASVTRRDKHPGIAAWSVTDVTDPLGAVRHVTLAAIETEDKKADAALPKSRQRRIARRPDRFSPQCRRAGGAEPLWSPVFRIYENA